MKLSEAIREGAKLRPQVFDAFFDYCDGGIGSCALGAAEEMLTNQIRLDTEGFSPLYKAYPHLDSYVDYPRSVRNHVYDGARLVSVITTLNDSFKWTREQIADWLEQQGF